MNIVDYADLYAERAHRGQTRKWTGAPYIEHPRRVAAYLRGLSKAGGRHDYYYTDSLIAAALLHDTVEDTGVTYDQLLQDFNSYVASVVQDLTNPPKSDHQGINRQARKKLDRERLAATPPEVQSIKLADRLDNLRDMAGAEDGFIRLYLKESRLLLEALTQADVRIRGELTLQLASMESPL